MYVLFFPQLIVGPIVKYREMADQLHDGANRCTPARAEHGAELFVFGLAKKVILADSIGALWTDIIGAGGVGLTNVSTPLAWLGIIAYSLQLYFDFAGYSEMSNGLAALLGFDCPANFNLPYISDSITEFWRRWHITLSGWFRDYIYIPLGGNRKGQARQLLNMFLVWAATGIWHGASWNFIAWGLYYFVLLTIEKTFLLKYLKKGKVWPHIYTLFFVVLGWGIFTANQPGAPLGLLLQKLFVPQGGISPVYYLRNYGVLLVLGGVLFCASLVRSAAHAAHYTVWRTESHLGSRGGFVRRYEMRLALEHLSYADLRRSPATWALGCCPVFVTAGSCRPEIPLLVWREDGPFLQELLPGFVLPPKAPVDTAGRSIPAFFLPAGIPCGLCLLLTAVSRYTLPALTVPLLVVTAVFAALLVGAYNGWRKEGIWLQNGRLTLRWQHGFHLHDICVLCPVPALTAMQSPWAAAVHRTNLTLTFPGGVKCRVRSVKCSELPFLLF